MPVKIKKGTKATTAVEPWDVQAVHHEFPTRSEEELTPAIEKCKKQDGDIKTPHKLAECVSDKIR